MSPHFQQLFSHLSTPCLTLRLSTALPCVAGCLELQLINKNYVFIGYSRDVQLIPPAFTFVLICFLSCTFLNTQLRVLRSWCPIKCHYCEIYKTFGTCGFMFVEIYVVVFVCMADFCCKTLKSSEKPCYLNMSSHCYMIKVCYRLALIGFYCGRVNK